ncbi:hypothetical protein BGZ96_009029 [Linnemannia gamsii]|uniref:SET domain-containing protein n=1 Tax=Linnemannia gamsii TaxID=64522 RepID=A0ABQ7KCP2_9FUNG|nr:hypothetical protein BGZ96_009029 [Linnemannia gamsii]
MTPLASFRRWAHTNGVVSKLVPKDSKGMGVGLFLVSTDLIDPELENILDQGELLLVPQDLLLTRSRVIQFNCSHLQKSLSIIGRSTISERLAIVLFILSQRLLLEHHATSTDHHNSSNKDSEQNRHLFADYIATLPDVSTPVTLEPELVRGYLAGTLLLDSVCAKRSKLEAEFGHLSGNLGVFEDWPVRPTLENFIWADATFWSRILSFKTQWTDNGTSSDADDDMHMVPYLDFANHSANPNIRWEVDSDGLRVWAYESLLQDSHNSVVSREVFLSYGNKPNTELLFLYGFTLQNNPTELLTLAMPMDEDDPYYMPKAHSLMRWGIQPRVTIHLNQTDCPDLEELCPGLWIARQSRDLLWLYALSEDDGLSALIEEPDSKVCVIQDSADQDDEEDALEEADLVDEDIVGRLVLTINDTKVETREALESIVPKLDIFPVIKLRILVLVAQRIEYYIARIMETGDKVQKAEDIDLLRPVQYDANGHPTNVRSPSPNHGEAPVSRLGRNLGDCLVPTILEPDHTQPITNRQLEAEAQVSNLVTTMKNYRAEEMGVLVAMGDLLGEAQTQCLEESDFIQSYLARMQLQDS